MSLRKQLLKRLRGRVVIIGIGNPLRGDDGAGCRAARLLLGTPHAHIFDAEEVPENILGDVVSLMPNTLILIDSVAIDAAVGTVALIEQGQIVNYHPTTHRMPIDLLMSYLKSETGADIFLLGIQPHQVSFGASISPEVETSCALLARILRETLAEVAGYRSAQPAEGAS